MILADPYPLTVLSPFRLSVVFGGGLLRLRPLLHATVIPFCGIEYIRVLFSETRDKPKLSFGSGPLAGEHRIEKGARVGKVSREKIRLVLSLIRLGQIKVSKWERVQVSPIIT